MEGSADHLVLADLTTLKPASPWGLRKEGGAWSLRIHRLLVPAQTQGQGTGAPGGVSCLGDGQSSPPPLQSHWLAVHPLMAEGHLGVTPSATHSSVAQLSFLKQHTEFLK